MRSSVYSRILIGFGLRTGPGIFAVKSVKTRPGIFAVKTEKRGEKGLVESQLDLTNGAESYC